MRYMEKECRLCHKTKDIEEFVKYKEKYRSECKACRNKREEEYREKNRDKI